jgi:hypothetical protein
VEWSRRLPVGLHAVDLTLHLHGDGPGERAHGINGDSLYVNLSRTMVLGASTLAWTFRPGGGRHYGN